MHYNTLTELDMEGDLIGAKGITDICHLLSVNTPLTKLNISTNNIGNEGAQKVSEALMINTTLTELSSEGFNTSYEVERECIIA